MINHPKRNRPKIGVSASPAPRARKPARRRSDPHDYSALLEAVCNSFERYDRDGPLFQTDATGLFELYLDSLPGERQHHNCTACRRFVERFGGLATVTEDGRLSPVMWSVHLPGSSFYANTFDCLKARVGAARIVSPFLTKERTWGQPITGEWRHMSIVPPEHRVYRERALTPGQAMAAAKENLKNVKVALEEFPPALLDEGLRIVRADALDRSERFLAPLAWLRAQHDRPKGRAGDNVLWLAVATAPEGFCHPRASVVGSLLEDLKEGMGFARVKERFDAKVRPHLYQRPQAAPPAGNVAAAEKLFEKLGLARALERRFARFHELQVDWTPHDAPPVRARGAGLFEHVKVKGGVPIAPSTLPERTLTWVKFAREVMPRAARIEFLVPSHGNFIAFTTAVHPDAPPILKWDREDERNPVSMYVYTNGSHAASWKLSPVWTKVNAIAPFPNLWGSRPMTELFDGAMLVLDGAQDTRGVGNALFPETLKSDLHGVRATIEAYSKGASLAERGQASACGYAMTKAKSLGRPLRLRAFVDGGWQAVMIDRWD